MNSELRKTGVNVVGDVPWGTHFCHFYQTKDDLFDILIPYFISGLENNEFCLWVVFEPLTVEEALNTLRKVQPDLNFRIAAGEIEIVPHTFWFQPRGNVNLQSALDKWKEKLFQALSRGFEGMRTNCNEAWLRGQDWEASGTYEEKLNAFVADQELIMLCTFPFSGTNAAELLDTTQAHQFSVIRRHGVWEAFNTPQLVRAEAEVQRLNEELETQVLERTIQLEAENISLRAEIKEHKEGEELLEKNERRLRALVENGPDGITILNPDGTIQYVSPSTSRITGYDREELIGSDPVERIHPDDRELIATRLFESIKHHEKIFTLQYRMKHKDGSWRWVEAVVNNLLDEPSVKGIVFNYHDITVRVEAKEANRLKDELLRMTGEMAMVGGWEFDAQTQQGTWTDEVARIHDLDLNQPTNVALGLSFYSAEHRQKIEKAVNDAIELAKPYELELEMVTAKGNHKWVRTMGLPILENGKVIKVRGIFQDVTERKQAEEQLRYQVGLLSNASDAIISMDMAFNIKSWNNAAETIYGWTAEEVMGKYAFSVIPIANFDKDFEGIVNQVINEGQWQGEVIQQVKSGGKRNILSSITLLRDESGIPSGAVTVNRDITDRKQDEEQLRLQSAALQSTANSILITNRQGAIQWVNPAFTQLTGYTLAEAVGKNMRDLVKSDKQDGSVYKDLWKTVLAGQVWHGELINRRKDGTFYIEDQTITPLLGEFGEITHFIGVQQDITDRKNLEEDHELLTAQFYQAQKMESIGRLAGGIAHDFNNLLVPIISNAELNMIGLDKEDPHYIRLLRIKEAGHRAAGLTRQILAFSRQQEMEKKLLDLNETISEFEPMLHRLIGEDVVLQTRLADSLPSIMADKGQLEQVLMNLVVNARDAMPEGGRLLIETSQVILDEAYAAKHSDAQVGLYAMMAVSDNGFGMDALTQQRIFEPFFTTKGPGEGTGLGLATVFGIVKQHDGNVWVYSEPGHGTTFKVYLPVAVGPETEDDTEEIEMLLAGGTETVLLVEDENAVRQLVGEILREYGYQVLEAAEPEKGLALAAVHDGPINLLLSDVVMPQMNGRKLYELLAEKYPKMKVLFISGYTHNIIDQQDIMTEEAAFLQKPFTIEALLQKVRAVLG